MMSASSTQKTVTVGRPEPMSLDGIFETLTTSGVAPENRAYAIVALNSVAHHPTVKKILSNPKYQPVLRCLVNSLALGDEHLYEARWEILATIGELCRVEHNPETRTASTSADAANAASNTVSLNMLAKYFYSYFGNLSFFKAALSECINEVGGDEDAKIAAKDILEAFTVPSGGGKCTTSKAAASAPVEEDELGEDDSPLATKWTKDTKARCKNLLYIDASDKYHLVPLVAKGSSAACAKCSEALSTETEAKAGIAGVAAKALRCGQCKAVFYCSQACQVAHWKEGHKVPCTAQKVALAKYLEAGGSRAAKGAAIPFPLEQALYYPTRRFMYECRPENLKKVSFQKLFMEYNLPDLL